MHTEKVTAVVPARNCRRQLHRCLTALAGGSLVPRIIVVDDGSEDGAARMVKARWPQALLMPLSAHTGYAHAANAGLRAVTTPYAFLIRPDIVPGRRCVQKLLEALEEPGAADRRGEALCAVPWRTGRGEKRKRAPVRTLAAADGCAMYRMEILEETGWLDERHFEGLEAFDLSLRAALLGFPTLAAPGAAVRTEDPDARGAGTFRRQLAAGNGRYIFYKNLPGLAGLAGRPAMAAAEASLSSFFSREGRDGAFETAKERGRILCELEAARRGALSAGAGVFAENLSDAAYLGMDDAAKRVYPLYLAPRLRLSPLDLPALFKVQRLLFLERHEIAALLSGG